MNELKSKTQKYEEQLKELRDTIKASLNTLIILLSLIIDYQHHEDKEKALENELEGARTDFKHLNSQLDQSERTIQELTTTVSERDSVIESGRLELEQLGKERVNEKTSMETEINSLKVQLQQAKSETAQVIE